MEEREQGSSPTKPKCPFKKQVWFETSMLGKQRVPVDSMKNKCRELLQVAQGRVIARDPDMDAKSKDLLVDTSEQPSCIQPVPTSFGSEQQFTRHWKWILSSLDKGLQLRVFDPDKVVDLVHRKRPLAKEVRARCEHLEQRIRRAEMLWDQLKQQSEQEKWDKAADHQSTKNSCAERQNFNMSLMGARGGGV
ncbi:uncharacterized protein LOC142557221 isoform X2 [Dermacentor variabilis]|uniref:uncharacterized protein LOC142557221 isoform X2 n=1 Tax=Dermacentor variabilis TaxID=34621 RepID=UPI003F5B6FAE